MGKDLCERLLKTAQSGDEIKFVSLLNDLISENSQWIDCRNKNSDNILHVASRNRHLNIIRVLFENYDARCFINVGNKTGKTPLHEAAQNCYFEIAEYLLSKGAECNPLTCNGWTPLMLASSKCEQDALKTVDLLIQYNADPLITNKDGWTAFQVACRSGDVRIVEYFIKRFPGLVLEKSKNGRYAIHTAALYGHLRVVEMLVQAEPGIVSVPDFCGTTPIHEAVRCDSVEMVRLLTGKGASIDELDSMGLNCLHMAAQAGSISVLNFLVLKCGVNVNVINNVNKFTPLHYAAQSGQSLVIQYLLEYGADPHMEDDKGRTALAVSYGKEHENLVRILQEHMEKANVKT